MARVCMVAYSEYVSDARIRREAESLVQRGDHVELICLPHESGMAPITLNGVRLFPLSIRRYRGSSNWRYALSYVVFLLQALAAVTWKHLQSRYDLVQVHTMPDFMVFAALVPRLTGAGVLLDVHDLMPELYMSKFGLGRHHPLIRAIVQVERASVAFAHKAIAVHQAHLEAMVSHGSPPQRFEVLLNTPDPALFRQRDSQRRKDAFKIVYHGTISRRHGLELALRAVSLARGEIQNLRLSIIGDGDDLGHLMYLASELGLKGLVEFTRGFVPVSELPALLSDADVGVVPLTKDAFTQYMLPVKLMEYVALGIPAIVTRTRTIEQYFDDTMVEYITGDSAEELARSIIALHGDPELRTRLSTNAAGFTKRHDWNEQKLVYYRLVDSLVAPQRRILRRVVCGE